MSAALTYSFLKFTTIPFRSVRKVFDAEGLLIVECAGMPSASYRDDCQSLCETMRRMRAAVGVTKEKVASNRRAGDSYVSVTVGQSSMGGGQQVCRDARSASNGSQPPPILAPYAREG